MAQVLAPIVQTSGSITMLHTPADAFQNNNSSQPHHQQSRSAQMPRSHLYNTQTGGIGYRGASSAPIAAYAFQSTPPLRQEASRASSAPGNIYGQPNFQTPNTSKLGHPSHPSSSSDSTVSTSSSNRSVPGQPYASKDDTALSNQRTMPGRANDDTVRRSMMDTHSASAISISTSVPDLSFSSSFDTPVKPLADRYRRGGARRADSSNSTVASSSTPTQAPQLPNPWIVPPGSRLANVPPFTTANPNALNRPSHNRANSADDMQIGRESSSDAAKRYRRRSLGGFEANALAYKASATGSSQRPTTGAVSPKRPIAQEAKPQMVASRPGSSHERHGSSGSVASNSTPTRPASSRRDSATSRGSNNGSSTASNTRPHTANPSSRGPTETKRVATPSPLSKPISAADSDVPSPSKATASSSTPSAAVQQLTALNDKETNKGMKSRLRRAFSFGSAAELRKASAENNLSAERARLRKERYQDDMEAEHDAIAAKQEAAGIGAGIYSGQGGFSGSTDNLSISSTASSASIMLRKMGSNMKRGSRSIKGLFRPKSVIGVPAADHAVTQPSVGQVSMVTVEAEREKVNVNVNPHDQAGGGTGYPKLERNSLDAARAAIPDAPGSSSGNGASTDAWSRKSILGGERERAEVLSSMKKSKGILKRTGSPTQSPVVRPVDVALPTDTPKSSAPSTPNDDPARSVHVHINGEDYFAGGPRLPNPSTRSLPNTPHGNRNISFNTRVQFHDAWSSSEYDRRGDIATCNRLTPILAQQIKEELNTFKMEMEVHEQSKPHTHFF
ncbi:uncharacterized protein BDZ99DRAFT_138598 [Mytilinidion resinicola]|uniref:Protein BNI4 n=1 Tax=Mytilinidion resinicola TaxID=574789 RepID=A0A6A6Z794_9PEZI|nr:uncharacterized protein BDZ99DRAFT_138598 [Mytilinidion resinicola]KAF2816543.1 hypothetical protein BDZ99DRAFT_138598 [Mytilinidion resinicola]